MDSLDQKNGVDILFRQNVLTNVIIKKIKERYYNSDDPNLNEITDIAMDIEKKMFIKATSKDDYLAEVVKNLNMMEEGKLVDISKAPTVAIASLPDADQKLLIDQYQHARLMYLPEIVKELKSAEEQCFQRQNGEQLETGLRSRIAYYQRIISFFHIPDSELLCMSKESLRHTLNNVIQYINPLSKTSTTSAGNQGPQSSYGQIRLNNMQMTPSEHIMSIKKSMSWMLENESLHAETSAFHPPLHGSLHATKQVDMKILQHHSTEVRADKNTFQSISEEVLRSSSDDIASAVNAVNELSTYANDFDSKFSPAIYGSTGDGDMQQKKMKCDIDSVTGVASTSDNHGSCRKKPRKEVNYDLMNEIREINQRLLETVLEVDFDSDFSNGTIIKCTYKPVSCSKHYKRHFAFMDSLAVLSIEILVPPYYPSTPLKILDRQPVGCCVETKNLMEKAKSRFNCCVLAPQGLMSLGDTAQAWDDSARSVFTDFALSLGGESFSFKYGPWECVPAVR